MKEELQLVEMEDVSENLDEVIPVLENKEAKKKLSRRHVFGITLIILVVFIWVGSSNFMQFIFLEREYKKPFFLTYFSTTLFSIYLFGFLIFPKWRHPEQSKYTSLKEDGQDDQLPMLSIKEVIKISAMFCPLWFGANYFFNASLTMTSVSSNTILSTTSGLWTLILGAIIKIDKFSFVKLLAVILSFGGIVLVSLTDKDAGEDSIWGDLLSLLSAILYACYSTLLKKKIDSEERIYAPMFFGFLGVLNAFALSPFLILLSVTGIESFELPSPQILLFLLVNGLIGTVLSDYIWLLSVLLTSPLIATLGLSLTTVLAMIIDFFFKGEHFPPLYILGASGILAGFFLVNTEHFFPSFSLRRVRRQQ